MYAYMPSGTAWSWRQRHYNLSKCQELFTE